ncbi:MAG: hypothetical protein JXR96_07590 [Deltaproteobacteria bacterium]|nr:hypothetical protein [Deltaproteobacteria bacterium]
MLEEVKKKAFSQAMKLLSHPKVAQLMSNPRVISALTKGFELHGQMRSRVEGSLRHIAESLNLATREEVQSLRRNLSRVEDGLVDLQERLSKK